MRRGLLAIHRALGLAALTFWLVQAATGTMLAYRWEFEDALLPGPAERADSMSLGARLEAIVADGGRVKELWASSAASTRFDIYYDDARGKPRVVRVDGAGHSLRDAEEGGWFADGAVFDSLTSLHTTLLVGEAGRWIVAASGTLLLTNVILGLRLAWPPAGGWLRALLPRIAGSASANARMLHRALGLWLGFVFLPLAGTGILLCFEHELGDALGAEVPPPAAAAAATARSLPAGEALAIAAARYPDAALSAFVPPSAQSPWFLVRQRRPGDLPRNWGTSYLFVAADDGRILADYPASSARAGRRVYDTLYPLHTGQFAGTAGRSLVLALGIWLVTMIVLGLRMQRARRRPPAISR